MVRVHLVFRHTAAEVIHPNSRHSVQSSTKKWDTWTTPGAQRSVGFLENDGRPVPGAADIALESYFFPDDPVECPIPGGMTPPVTAAPPAAHLSAARGRAPTPANERDPPP